MSRDVADGTVFSSDVTICDLEVVAARSNIHISSVMSEAYHAIDDPDGIYGCSSDQHGSTAARSVTAVKSYDIFLGSAETNFVNRLKTCLTTSMILRHIFG